MFENEWIGLCDRDGNKICEGDTLWCEIVIRELNQRTGRIQQGVVKYDSNTCSFKFDGHRITNHSYNDFRILKKCSD